MKQQKLNAQLHQQLLILASAILRTYNIVNITSIGQYTVNLMLNNMCSQEHKKKEEIKKEVDPQQLMINVINQIIRRIQQEEANLHIILIEADTETESEENSDDELPNLI